MYTDDMLPWVKREIYEKTYDNSVHFVGSCHFVACDKSSEPVGG